MDENRVRALARLDELGIPYDLSEHPAVYTIAEMDALQMEHEGEIAKNLFLRDKKGKRHFLVMLKKDKTADLALLAERIGCDKLSFASEERLGRYLGLVKGAVTPLGVVNDTEALVEVVLDADLSGCRRIGMHPCDNTATVWLEFSDVERFVRENGNRVQIFPVP